MVRSRRGLSLGGRCYEQGQASVELIAMLPVGATVMLAALQLLAAGAAHELAGHAAGAGAVALLESRDAEAAARDAVPDWSRGAMQVDVEGSVVSVRLRPRALVPGLAKRLESTSRADAGTGS